MRTLLKNGRILDPSQELDAIGSVLIENDQILDFGPGLNDAQAAAFAKGLDKDDQARLKGAFLYWKSFVDPLVHHPRPVGQAVLDLSIERFVSRVRHDTISRIKSMTPLGDAARRSPENRAAMQKADRDRAAEKRGKTPVAAE